ncbi:MAG: hypothetical protein HYZ81_21510 [Nitrospinae bacterium]|nr:hypothetical protein [Nitrospinota bacterium]
MDRKPRAVRWYGSRGLFRQLRRIIRLAIEGDAIDAKGETGRKLLLLSVTPVVVSGCRDGKLENELTRVVGSAPTTPPKFQLRLDLAGDTHNYQRYELDADHLVQGGRRIAVVAAGGACLHGPQYSGRCVWHPGRQ